MSKRKVVCCFKPGAISYYACVPPEVPHRLAEYGFDFVYCENIDQFLKQLPDAEIAITFHFKPEWVSLAPKLKWVATNAAGKERIAEAELLKRGVKVSYGRFHGRIMAETVLGMMLFTARGLGTSYRLQVKDEWCDSVLQDQVSILNGKICLILGYGNIGRYLARLTKCFGMYNIGVKRSLAGEDEYADRLITVGQLREYLPLADHIVTILPGGSETDDLISGAELALVKPSACLYNVGRGNCIDETALFHALKERKLAWACLDVFKAEPLSWDSPLRTLDNILILPHASAFAPEYYLFYFEEFMEDFRAYLE